MARYVDDYQGIPGHASAPRGMDPNYRGGYRGMRMGGDPGQGAYGMYRWRHQRDLEGEGGFTGRGSPYDAGYRGGPRRFYDFETRGGGGLRNPRYDRDFLRGFNAYSPEYRREEGRERGYGGDYRAEGGPIPSHDRYRFGYTNRGLGSGGFSEAWQHRPAHGSR